MKKYFSATALVCFFALVSNAATQDTTSTHNVKSDTTNQDDTGDATSPKEATSIITPKNIVKINLSSFAVKTLSLQYERVLMPKMTACLGIRVTPKGSLPYANSLSSAIGTDGDNDATIQFIKDFRLGGWAITPEFRYYLGKGYGKGFYIGLFGRYERFDLNSVYAYKDDNDVITNIAFSGHYASTGIGLLLGSQFLIGNRITLDWWILGPYYAKPKIELDGSGFNLSDNDRDQLQDDLNGIEINFSSFKTTSVVTNTTANLKVGGGSLPLLRGFGLCLGVRL